VEFVANYDTKAYKKHKHCKNIHWVSFNLHKDLEDHYRGLVFSLKPFNEPKIDSKSQHFSWKYAYVNAKDDTEKSKNKICI